MLDERPPADAPARASAIAGANTTLAQKNSAKMMRHFGSGLAVALLAQNLRSNFMRVDMGRVRAGGSTTEPNILWSSVTSTVAFLSGVEPTGPSAAACLIGQRPAPK